MDGVSLPPDEVRCRRRGTPNWRCPHRALPGKTHCLKHYLFYVSRRQRQKITESAGGNRISDGVTVGIPSSVEPYRPVIDFDLHNRPVQAGGISLSGGGGGNGNRVADWTGGEIMGRFGEVDLWNGKIALGRPCHDVANDRIALGGERKLPQPSAVVNFDEIDFQKPKSGRPKGSKNKKKREIGRDDDESVKNLRWIMRDKHFTDSDSQKDDDDDDDQGLKDEDDDDDFLFKFGELPTILSGGNQSILPKKRGRPKGSKNKLKIHS